MSFHGQVTSKSNTKVFDMKTDALPMEGERDFLEFLLEDIIIASVLSSLSLSLFTVIQVLTSSVHFCMERRRSGI